MAQRSNPGQFGQRSDTREMASRGGRASSGRFGEANGADPSEAGRKGAEAEPREAKVLGGKNSHKNSPKKGGPKGGTKGGGTGR